MQNPEPHKLLEASPLFRHMPLQEAETILARLQAARFVRGETILERGTWHGKLYIIAAGQVRVLLQNHSDMVGTADDENGVVESPGNYTVAHLGPGECFGEMSLLTGDPPGATVQAEQDTTLWSLNQADFLVLASSCPTLLQNINTILSQRLARANQHLVSTHVAEVIMLSLLTSSKAGPEETALSYHIAEALAIRSQKRVLLLELCCSDDASSTQFAIQPGQLRPSLGACDNDSTHLQLHRAPLPHQGASYLPAVATLTDTDEQSSRSLFTVLPDLTEHYDFILLVTTPRTPSIVVQMVADLTRYKQLYTVKQQIVLVAENALEQFTVPSRSGDVEEAIVARAVFVMHHSGPPTIAVQEHYEKQLGCAVTRLLSVDKDLLERGWQQRISLWRLAPEAILSKAVDFVARYIARQTVGIAFGGGGARGFAHLGVLDGLLTHGIPLDYIAGCSSGIIAPGMYLLGKSIAESEEIFMEIQRHVVQLHVPRTSIFSNRGLKWMLHDLCGEMRFEDLTTPFAMVAADLTTRAGVVLERGPIWRAGLASVALPGIFPPVIIGKHILIDAGMHDPVPIRLVRRMGAHVLLASELGGQEPPQLMSATPWLEEAATQPSKGKLRTSSPPHIVDLVLRTYDLAMATIGMHSIREADVVIRPSLYRISLRQFSEGRKFVRSGREAVEQSLPELRKHLPWV